MAGSSGSSRNEFRFEKFYEEEWVIHQRYYLKQLQSSNNQSEEELKKLIASVQGHYQQYYIAKSKAARQDVFTLFSPLWFTTYERSFLWITGFKPGLAFSLLGKSVADLSETQSERIARLKEETREKEKVLNNELASIQEGSAEVNVVQLTKELGRQLDGATELVNDELEKLRERMEGLVHSADYLRMWTAREVLEVLTPVQSVKFLAALSKFQIRMRCLGKYRDARGACIAGGK